MDNKSQPTPSKQLTLFDSTCIIVGIIIGAGIYQMAPAVAQGAGNWWAVLLIWVVGGLLSLCGALGYAELASAYPQAGGDYVYLSRAYGRWTGFLFGWVQLTIVRPGDIAIMAFAFATYARAAYDPLASYPAISQRLFAALATLVLTLINIAGVKQGKWTQNLLTVAKALGLLAIVGVIVLSPGQKTPTSAVVGSIPMSLALVFVLFTYGGWNEMAYVAGEVKNPKKNITRALVLGTVAVMGLYLLMNAAFLYSLGYAGLAQSEAVARDSIATAFPDIGGQLISILVCVSALGAVNGLIFAGARITYAMGTEHRSFALLGQWHQKTATPVWALIIQCVIAISLILVFGSFVDTLIYTAAAVYGFYLATNLALIVLRFKEPGLQRPYRVTGYPVPTIIFCAVCMFLIYSTVTYAWAFKRLSLVILAVMIVVGLVVYAWETRQTKRTQNEDS